ncbi:Arabinanase/levansucrase/invertase [Aspergillus bertholletiae]|uniref:Arabinanase/levansucrase/invertase n=1 Tax=Aspergillus bertholletiae TaxID=1226010 RepID=A0A5N7BKE1_9EURO|nr:Arabinanase/levansucrase/invertase [Aspergillus bertholletiae]
MPEARASSPPSRTMVKSTSSTTPERRVACCPTTTSTTDEKRRRHHPCFALTLAHLRSHLYPLVSSTTALAHPEFPTTLLAYHLLTSRQLDELAIHYHQVWPPTPATSYYPVVIPPWVGTENEKGVDIETKRRRFGRFIGLQRCETPAREEESYSWEMEQKTVTELPEPMNQHEEQFQSFKMANSNPPLITHIYTADPSAHVFNNKLYIYPSHDRETDIQFNDNGDQYDMADYHVFSMESISGPVTDHGTVLTLADVPWASKQLWAPDAASKNGKYYLYLPARDHDGIFRIGVAVAEKPEGPFTARESFIPGSYSIDPASFVDDDGTAYLYFGGIWGGQLQCWSKRDGGWVFDASKTGPQEPSGSNELALHARVAQLTDDMLGFASPVQELVVLDRDGESPIMADDHEKRFFEASWMHKYNGTYYFSYSTGDTHYIAYATGESPLGPFRYRGRILEPVLGWTTHHSIVEFGGRWWIFYHDCELSKGVDHLRSVKVREIKYDDQGEIYLV